MLTARTPPIPFSPTNKKVLHCFCTVTSETQICNNEAFTHQQSYGKSRGLISCIALRHYAGIGRTYTSQPHESVSLWFLCNIANYAWPVDTSLSLWLTPIPHSLMYLPDHQHPVYLVGSWYIRLGYSFRLFNFWRHIMTLYTSICL